MTSAKKSAKKTLCLNKKSATEHFAVNNGSYLQAHTNVVNTVVAIVTIAENHLLIFVKKR